ncbi:cob(I)yrinic acid a,c-diamide adenosyltransferase [Paenibacillus xerothermodurans]|uniref:Corrinoid adenosyltransferase n=1 Tax=Paenibacillus xerothermodurans TaxID=1977292 RepID=A0A2W1NXN4_PAEXE|nr:cob(I)yrinic acid a,c-diamide adenosyltransferase [Paenibacillus xerothermodurans]PZE20372.1 cob(I)yrinic acid a,c-diamide adenosyltransferase [Paenibacillus xerothermodurans]
MRIYTRTGDAGQTGVIGGRVDKDDVRVEAYGTVDELNCFVGQAMALLDGERFPDLLADLLEVQNELFDCGSDLALLKQELRPYKVTSDMVDRLETWIDKYDGETPDIKRFILPGGTHASSVLHVCRTVCRRAERRVVTLGREQPINEQVRRYLNRLSDFFFTAARAVNSRSSVPDVEYVRSAEVFRRK